MDSHSQSKNIIIHECLLLFTVNSIKPLKKITIGIFDQQQDGWLLGCCSDHLLLGISKLCSAFALLCYASNVGKTLPIMLSS